MTTKTTTVLDARAVERTLKRMSEEIVELNDGTDDLIIVGIQRRGVQLADRLVKMIEGGKASTFRRARSTSRSIATTSRRSDRDRSSGPTASPVGHRRQARRDRRRRALHRTHRARGARRARGLRTARRDRAGRAHRSRRTRAADSRRTSSARRSTSGRTSAST